jgi:glycosyltransferase involved in cell wall biosynthesis
MACGAAVVSTDHDTAPGLVDHGRNGILVPVGDLDAMVEAIHAVLNNSQLRNAMVAEGLKTVSRFSWEASARKMSEFIEDLRSGWCSGAVSSRSA